MMNISKRGEKLNLRFGVLTNLPFGILIFKALCGSVPEMLEFQIIKLYPFSGRKPNVGLFVYTTYCMNFLFN